MTETKNNRRTRTKSEGYKKREGHKNYVKNTKQGVGQKK